MKHPKFRDGKKVYLVPDNLITSGCLIGTIVKMHGDEIHVLIKWNGEVALKVFERKPNGFYSDNSYKLVSKTVWKIERRKALKGYIKDGAEKVRKSRSVLRGMQKLLKELKKELKDLDRGKQ